MTMARQSRLALAVLLLLAGAGALSTRPAPAQIAKKKVLVVTATAGFRHDSIPTAKEVLKQLADRSGDFVIEFANDAAEVQRLITAENLKNYDAVVFANTTGDLPLSDENKKAFMEW